MEPLATCISISEHFLEKKRVYLALGEVKGEGVNMTLHAVLCKVLLVKH